MGDLPINVPNQSLKTLDWLSHSKIYFDSKKMKFFYRYY